MISREYVRISDWHAPVLNDGYMDTNGDEMDPVVEDGDEMERR